MGVVYSRSDDDEQKLKKIIREKKYSTFHTSFVDENGKKNSDGSVKQIIFGSEALRKKSYNDLFLKAASNFELSINKVEHLIEIYPIFYSLYEKYKIENCMKILKIDKVEQIDNILKTLLNGATFVNEPKQFWINCLILPP